MIDPWANTLLLKGGISVSPKPPTLNSMKP